MASVSSLSAAKVILLAVQYACDSQLQPLQILIALRPQELRLELVLRILLTFLPESTEPALYIPLLHQLQHGDSGLDLTEGINVKPVQDVEEGEARKRIRRLRLLPLASEAPQMNPNNPALANFLIHRAHRIDAETGLINMLPSLLDPFLHDSESLQTWFISTLLPLLRLSYEYYPMEGSKLSLEAFERLEGAAGIEVLLSKSGEGHNGQDSQAVGRDLRGLVGPWMYGSSKSKRRKLDAAATASHKSKQMIPTGGLEDNLQTRDWPLVFNWIVSTAQQNFDLAVRCFEEWGGPLDVDLGGYQIEVDEDSDEGRSNQPQYGQAALAAIYTGSDGSLESLQGAHRILCRMSHILDIQRPPDLPDENVPLPHIGLFSSLPEDLSATLLLNNALLHPQNNLTLPTEESLSLASALLISANIFLKLGRKISMKILTDMYLTSTAETQLDELQKLTHNGGVTKKRDDKDWIRVRQELLWLRNWGQKYSPSEPQKCCGLLGEITQDIVETEILKAFLAASDYHLSIDTYIKPQALESPLPLDQVERTVIEVALNAYDNASNGNRTRGLVKKASDILAAFRPYFGDSVRFRQTEALIKATHSMSFYALALHRGVPFKPVNIRVHNDPISLLQSILEQNAGSYTKLDDLIGIGKNLVAAGLPADKTSDGSSLYAPHEDPEILSLQAEQRITGMAIDAALAEDDFETAYSYVVNRLTPPNATIASSTKPTARDDISWRAAFSAGRHRPQKPPPRHGTINPELRRLDQRMDLLSQALLLAPASALPEILGVWRRCEEEMNVLLAQETEAERKWDDKGDRRVPGGFMSDAPIGSVNVTRREMGRASNEEAPMGLFDVARGAAAAIQRSAFPLRGASGSSSIGGGTDRVVSGTSFVSTEGSEFGGPSRVRKRDMVSSMVTGGLASGIGWVLGATPVNQQDENEE